MEPNSNRFVSNNKNDKEYLSSIIKNLYISLNPDSPKNYNLPQYFENLILRIISTNFNVLKNDERRGYWDTYANDGFRYYYMDLVFDGLE